MSSTNDGKEVKSNQTSGRKGKSYYIELYKSLETRLVEPGSGSQRTRAVCEAWRRVHSLCQHSAPSTHPHLHAWIQRHTSQTILQTDWRQSDNKEEQHAWLQEAIDAFIAECNEAITTRKGVAADWENLLLERAQWFRTVLKDPWGHPVLKALVNSQGDELTDPEVLEWLKEEKDITFVARLRQLAASRSCMDLALRLATAVMDRARATGGVQPAKPTHSETSTKSQFVTILENEAGFTSEVWDFVKDIEFVLLYSESRSRCIDLAKQQQHANAYQLVERLRNRLERSPRDKKVWKNAKEVATLIAQVVIARCMVVPTCTGDTRIALYGCARSLVRLLPADKLPTAAAALAAPAATARHLHTLALAVHTECKTERMSFVCELYVRAITAGMNELERLKIKTDKESEARSAEKMLSTWFTQLGSILSASARMSCECILTAFSVHPTPFMYEQVKIAPPLEPLLKDIQEPKHETNSEFGSWATDSRTQTNLVKTSETLNLKSQKQTNVLSTAMFTEGEALGLEAELCQDLAVLISGPRVKTLSWDMDRESLLENCRTYMERTHGGTRALTTELKYLNLDPRSFQHLPEEEDDENDLYYGIEKGYEHLLETSEEIWQNTLSDDSEKTDTAHSTDECAIDIPKQKKKTKRSQYCIEDVDPLSMTEETNRTELQERTHSKERSKERRRKKHNMKDECNQEKTNDLHKKEKKKERKKKEKYETIKDTNMHNPEGNLSKLVGLKVCRVPDDKCITDSDYDSQGKSSINSECNNPSIIEDNFSIDDMKRSMYQYNELCLSRGVLSKEKTHKAPDKQKSQSLIKSSAHGMFSSYNPEMHVSEEVKKSIKQFVEMKQNNKFTVEPIFRKHENNYNSLNVTKSFPPASVNDNYIKGRSQTQNLQPKGNLIMNREKQLSSLKDEVNNVLKNCNVQDNSIKQKFSNVTVETFIPSRLSNEINKFKVDGTKSVQFGVNSSTVVPHPVQTPLNHLLPNTAKSSLLKKKESPSQCQFKEFLKQRSINPTITKSPIRNTFDTPSQMQFQEFLRQQNSFQPTSTLNNTKDIMQQNSQDQLMPITTAHKKLHTSNNKERMKIEDSYKQYPSVNLQNITRQVSPNITNSGNQNQYQHFLKELMEATNAGAVNDRSEINQPDFDKYSSNQHKKSDNTLNTFSRLSYLHKNKQNDNKHRLSLDRSSHPQSMSMEEMRTLDMNYSKISNRQSKGEVAVLKMDKTNPISENKNFVTNSIINNQYPVVSNMLLSGFRYHGPDIVQKGINNVENKNVSVGTSNLSYRDQNDLLLLFHQKSKMNAQSNNDNITGMNSKTSISEKSKVNDLPESSHNLNLDLSRPEISRIDKPEIKTSNSNTSSTTSELKKVRTVKASSKNIKQTTKENDVSNSDWESVMNALLSHKTPSRGPNALDIVLKKDSFEKRLANKTTEIPKAVKSSHARIDTVSQCGGSKTSLTKKDYTHDFKQRQDKKIAKVDMNMRGHKKMTPKMKDKQFSSFIHNGTDPFISGIPNSDFDLLGELMDDDLRKEIGELLDDDEVYGLGMSTPKTNIVTHNKNNPATSHKPQIIIDPRPNLSSENVKTKLDGNLQSRSNGVYKTIIHGKSTATLTTTNISNHSQLICDTLTPQVTVQKSNCKISSDAQANQCTKTIINIGEKNRSLLTGNKCNSGNEMIEIKMPKLQTCNFNILESPKVVLAVPQPAAPNVVLISNELVYKPLTLEVKQPEPQTQSLYSVNNYVKVNQLSGNYLAINQSSGSYVAVTQPSGGYVGNSQLSGSYVAVTQPSAAYMAVTQPVTPHYPVIIDTAVTMPVIQRSQDIPLVNNSPVDILDSEKRTKLKCTKIKFEETNLKTKEINTSEESKITSYSNNNIKISRDSPDKSLVSFNPTMSEENVSVSSAVTEPPVPVSLTSTVNTHKSRVSTETIKKNSESMQEFLNSSLVEMNPGVPEIFFTNSSKVIEPSIPVPVPLVLTPPVCVHKPRVYAETIRKDSEPSPDFLDSSSVKVNPKVPEKNVILSSKVSEPTVAVALPLVVTPLVRVHKPRISTESIQKDSEPPRDVLDSSSVKVNSKVPEKIVTLPSKVIEPTVTIPLVRDSINKPIMCTELLRKDSEPSQDFLDSSSGEVNPKVIENKFTISSLVSEPPVAVSVPIISASKPRVPTVTILKYSEPSDAATSIDRSNQSDCVEKIFLNNKIAKSKESNDKINQEDREFKFDKLFEDETKLTIRDNERIKQKRILLKNRLNHHNYCRNEPIALTYEPMYLQSDELSESDVNRDSKNEKNTITDLVRTNEYKNIINNTSPEMSNKAPNKNINMSCELPRRRIQLRSTNSLETIPVLIKPKSLQKIERKDKLKRKKLKKYKVLKNDLINNEIEQNTLNKVEEKSATNLPEEDLEDQIAPSIIKIPNKMNNIKIPNNGGLIEQKQITPISQITETTDSSVHDSNILHENNPNSNSKSNTFKNKTSQHVDHRFINSKDVIENKNYKNHNSYKANNGKNETTSSITTPTNSENLINSTEESKNKDVLEYKDKIIFEELPNVYNDQFKKCVRIKLPGGNTFKATISGKLNINIDSLFEEPTIKAMILKNINNNKKCTLNVKQLVLKNSENNCADTTQDENRSTIPYTNPVCDLLSRPKNILPRTVITQVRDLSTSVINETIDLISDDEENPVQTFKTEFGNFNCASMNEGVFLKHQRKLSQKCEVKVSRCDLVQETLKLTKEVISIKEKPLLPVETITDIIEIDDSSNDSENNAEKFNLTSLNVKDAVKITKLSENVNVLKDMLLNDIGVKDSTEKSIMNKCNVQTQNHVDGNLSFVNAEMHEVKSKKCVLKLDKCDELIKKMKIQKNICFVSLVRCDSLIRNTYCFNELSKFELQQNEEKIQTDDTKMESVKDKHMLRRSRSLSILNDFSVMEEDKSDRSSPSLIENLDIPLILPNNFNIKTSFNNSSTTYNCNAEWFMTKLYLINLHNQSFVNANNLDCFGENEKSQLDDKSTDCESDIENNLLADESCVTEEKSHREGELYQVLSLVKIITNFFANSDSIIERLKSGQERSNTVLYSSPLKRKYEEAMDKHRQKISKQENCHSCVASASKKVNLSQELYNHKLDISEEQCFNSVSDVKKYDENYIQALNINNLTQNKVSNIENDQQNNLMDSRKNKIGLDFQISKNKRVELDEKKFDKTKIQQIKYTTQYKKLNLKEHIGKINDINSSYDKTVEIKQSVNIIKNNVYDDVHQFIPVTKTKIENFSKDRLIDLSQKTLKKCVVIIEKCCTKQLSLSKQKSSISKIDDKVCELKLANSEMETTNTRTIEVSTVTPVIVTGRSEIEKIGSSKIDQNVDDTLTIKSKTDVRPSRHKEVSGHSDTKSVNGDFTVTSKLQDNSRKVYQRVPRITQGSSTNKPEDENIEFYEKNQTKESFEHKTYKQKALEEQKKCDCELDLGPENDLVEVIIPLNEIENTDIIALKNALAISSPLFTDNNRDVDKECKHRTSNIDEKHNLQNIENEKLDGKAILDRKTQGVHKFTKQYKFDEDTYKEEDSCSKNKIAYVNVTSNKHKASHEVKEILNSVEHTKCNATLGTNRSPLPFPRTESEGIIGKAFEVRNKANTDSTLQENITLVYNGDSLKGSIYENPIVGKCYLFCDNVCNDKSLNVIQALKSKIFEERHNDEKSGNTETKNTKFGVIIPNFTYSRQRIKHENTTNDHDAIEDRFKRKNLKRKIDSCDNKLNKKYRKGKNIDYPKLTYTSMGNTSYGKEYKQLFNYWSSIKFSFTRPFHKEYIDVSGILKCWPITEMHMDVVDLADNEKFLYLDNKLTEKRSSDPLKQTLAEEILSEYVEPESSCDEINENNFSMGFGERSDRVIQNSGDGDNISKFSAATLSDVKQSQPFLVSENNLKNHTCEFYKSKIEQMEINKRYFSFIQLRDKVRSVFRKTTIDLQSSWLEENIKNKSRTFEYCGKNDDLFPYDLFNPDFIEPAPIKATVHVVQVGQLPVSTAAQNPVTCDPRVTQVTDASPSQCSAENSPQEDSQSPIKTEYTELTTADLSLPLVQEHERHNEPQDSEVPTNYENITVKIEVSSEELSQTQEEENKCKTEPDDLQSLVNKHINNIEYSFESNDNNTLEGQSNPEIKCESTETHNSGLTSQQKQNGSSKKTDQIAHAMNAAGITTSPEPSIPENTTTQTLVNMFSQKTCQEVPGYTAQNTFAKASINTMTLQQALAQILPPPLNHSNSQESNQVVSNSPVASQVLHIVQGKNTNGSQITVVDNTQNSVINNSGTPVLHIVHNKGVNSTPTSTSVQHGNTYSGLSLVDAGLQQGSNQLLHIVNAGTQKNNATGQLLKRVNLLTNVQGSNEQKMLQFVCKSGDGKSIQLNAPHQRSMVLRLQQFESPGIQTNLKTLESQDISPSSNTNDSVVNKESNNSQHEIKSRSVYEENYAKFIQNSSNKTVSEKSTSLPKFNQAFGKQVFQDGNQKPNETSTNSSHLSSDTENDCQSSENTLNLDHIGQLSSPPLLLRKSPAQTSQTHSNLVHQIKQTIAPMMHGGVIYTRQIPVNIGGGQTINLITVPSTELIDDNNQKHHGDLKFVNQGEIESPIIKIVPQNESTDMKSEESNNHQTNTNDNVQNTVTQHQPVLTQMRIKLPMLSKAPQMVSGARVVRPSFFQIHRNVIGGANQPVYQQLVLTAAPPLTQHTIRLPHVQTRQVKIATENQSSESQMSSSTLEQLREFDMVLEQVKERSTVQPNCTNNFSKLNTSSDTTDSTSVTSTVTESTQQVLYSIGANQSLNVAYVNRKHNTTTTPSTAFVRSPDSSGILESASSAHVHIPHTVTSESTSNDASTQQNQQKVAKVSSKSRSRPKPSSHSSNSLKINTVPPRTSTQKPLEDEQTTQRILYILAEYKEQVENSPDKDKPAPRRRTNPPSNPGSSKRKKSSSSSRRSGARDVSPINGEDACRTMGSEDSSCGTSQGDCTESCLESHSPQDSPRKVVRKLTFENEISATTQPRTQPQRNVIVADGQTITVARGTSGKPTTAVLMPANYILPVSMVKGGQQIAIVTNRGPKLLTVGGGEGGTNALLLQRLIGPTGLKPVLAGPGVRHVRLPTAALHNLQAFNLATATTVQSQESAESPSPAPTPPELIETRANTSPWEDRESQDVKPEPESSADGSGPWLLTADPNDYSYEETVRTENIDRTVLDAIPDRYSPDMEAQRIFDKMFDVDLKKSYLVDSQDDSSRCAYDIDASDCDDKAYHQVVQKKYGRQHRLAHAALRHRYAMLENELRLQKSLSEECEDLGVDSPSASELFPEAELLFSSSPAHEAQQQSQTPQPTIINQSGVPQPDIDDQIASDHFLEHDVHGNQEDLGVTLGLDEGIVTVTEDGIQANITVDQEEFARSHPNTTFHSEPTEEGEVQPFTITDLKGRQITSTIFHAGRAPATVLVTAPQTTVISQATQENAENNVKYANIDQIINTPSTHRNLNLSSVVVKEDGLTKFDNILTDSREIHISNTASTVVHSTGNATKVIRRVCYEEDKREKRYLMDESDGIIAGDDAKMIAEDNSRDATLESMADVDEGNSSPERHTELFWESNSASERSRPLDFSSDSEKCCKSPFEETNSTDSSGVGNNMRLDSVIKEARLVDRAGSGSSDDHPPLRTYPAKRYHNHDGDVERSLSGKTRAGFQEDRLDSHEVRRRASGRGVVKRGCHCCIGSPAPPRPKKAKKKPTMDFNSN